MMSLLLRLCLHAASLALASVFFYSIGATAAEPAAPSAPAEQAIPADKLVQPADLAQMLAATQGTKPLILQVGSAVLFEEAHIPGSEYAGPAGQDADLQALRDRTKALAHDQAIVIYCGCCPWNKCPNIRRAYRELASLGFTNVKAMYVATDFGTDWVAKGYPVAKGR